MRVTKYIAAAAGTLLFAAPAPSQQPLPEEDIYLILLGGSAMVSRLDGGGNLAGCGSATLVEGGEYLVSNYHVINTARNRGNAGFKIAVHPLLHDGSETALIQVNHSDRIADQDMVTARVTEGAHQGIDRYALFEDLEAGAPVYTVGNPHCEPWQFSRGEILSLWRRSDLNRDRRVDEGLERLRENARHKGERYDELIVTSRFLAPGNSGGPVVDAWGRLIGVAFASGGSDYDLVLPIKEAVRDATLRVRTAEKDYLPPWYQAVPRPAATIPPTPAEPISYIPREEWEDANASTFVMSAETLCDFQILGDGDYRAAEEEAILAHREALRAEGLRHDLDYVIVRLGDDFVPQDYTRIKFQMEDALSWTLKPMADLEFPEQPTEARAFYIPETQVVAIPTKRTLTPDVEKIRLFKD